MVNKVAYSIYNVASVMFGPASYNPDTLFNWVTMNFRAEIN